LTFFTALPMTEFYNMHKISGLIIDPSSEWSCLRRSGFVIHSVYLPWICNPNKADYKSATFNRVDYRSALPLCSSKKSTRTGPLSKTGLLCHIHIMPQFFWGDHSEWQTSVRMAWGNVSCLIRFVRFRTSSCCTSVQFRYLFAFALGF